MNNISLFKADFICTAFFMSWFLLDINILWAFVPFLVMGVCRFAVVVVWIISKTIDVIDKYGIFRKKKNEVKEYWEFKD